MPKPLLTLEDHVTSAQTNNISDANLVWAKAQPKTINPLKALEAASATTTPHKSLIMNEQKQVLLMISKYLWWLSIVFKN